MNQDRESPSSCALCRKEMTPTEDLPTLEEDDNSDEDSYEDSDEDSYEDSDSDTDSDVDPAEIQRRLDRWKLQLGDMDENAAKLFAATKIQAVARGYFARQQASRLMRTRFFMKEMEHRIQHIHMVIRLQTIALRMGKLAWKTHVANKIQAMWRGFHIRKQRSGKQPTRVVREQQRCRV